MKEGEKREASFGYALFLIVLIFGAAIAGNAFLGLKMEVLFMLGWLVAFPLCMRLGYTYKELENSFYDSMRKACLPVTFMLIIGGMSGIWNASGTIAGVTYIGLGLINPQLYQISAFLICLLFSLIAGTSWGTAGTIGIALMGVGLGVGLSPAVAAAPIISAAFIGDMSSPISDTPNLIAGATGVNLMDHCKNQLKISIPAAIVIAVIYLMMGLGNSAVSVDINEITALREAIAANYRLGWLPFVPLVIVVGCIISKIPTIPSILCGTVSAGLIAWLYQGTPLATVVSTIWKGFQLDSGNAVVDKLFSRGGMTSMSGTAFMTMIALGLFGILSAVNAFEVLVRPLTKKANTPFLAAVLSVVVAFFVNLSGGTTFCVIFTGETMGKVYEEKGFNLLELSTAISIGALLFCTVIPWHRNAIPPATYLGVELVEMLPHMFMPWVFLAVFVISARFSKKRR